MREGVRRWRRRWSARLRLAALLVFAAIALRLLYDPARALLRGCAPTSAQDALLDAAGGATVWLVIWALGGLAAMRGLRRWILAAQVAMAAILAADLAAGLRCR